MKEIKKLLRESLVYSIIENYLEEDYPTNFNLEEFSKLTSYNKRIQYCQERLKRISSGSSRIVYMVDDTKVLKIAKNKKGLAQNDIEATYSNYDDIDDIVAKVFAYDNNDLWVEMELAKKVTLAIFKQIVGYSFEDYCGAISNHYYDMNPKKQRGMRRFDISQEMVDEMYDNEFIYSIFSFLGSYEAPVGDLLRLNTYGLVKRNGQDTIVIIDYGIDSEVYDTYYS